MEDLRTIALSALIRETASKIGYANVKPKQLEAVLDFCKGIDVFVSLLTGYNFDYMQFSPRLVAIAGFLCPA